MTKISWFLRHVIGVGSRTSAGRHFVYENKSYIESSAHVHYICSCLCPQVSFAAGPLVVPMYACAAGGGYFGSRQGCAPHVDASDFKQPMHPSVS